VPQEKPKKKRKLKRGEHGYWESLLNETKAIRRQKSADSVRTIKEYRRNRARTEMFSQRDPGLNRFGVMDAYPPAKPPK
jgi:hypothetical protein